MLAADATTPPTPTPCDAGTIISAAFAGARSRAGWVAGGIGSGADAARGCVGADFAGVCGDTLCGGFGTAGFAATAFRAAAARAGALAERAAAGAPFAAPIRPLVTCTYAKPSGASGHGTLTQLPRLRAIGRTAPRATWPITGVTLLGA